jgi:hypothetical protein
MEYQPINFNDFDHNDDNDDDDDLPPLVEPDNELAPLDDNYNDLPPLIYTGRIIAMPSECSTNPLQRALADSIIRMVNMDELRILLACGAKVSENYCAGHEIVYNCFLRRHR